MNPPQMKVIQINLHHSRNATFNLISFISTNDICAALIQEPWLNGKNEISGLNLTNYKLYFLKSEIKKRSCILIKSCYKCFLLEGFCTGDITSVLLERSNSKPLCMVSAYFPYEDLSIPNALQSLSFFKSKEVGPANLCRCERPPYSVG